MLLVPGASCVKNITGVLAYADLRQIHVGLMSDGYQAHVGLTLQREFHSKVRLYHFKAKGKKIIPTFLFGTDPSSVLIFSEEI